MKYNVEIVETLSRIVEVEADSWENAVDDVIEQYRNCDIVLDDDYWSTQFICIDEDGKTEHVVEY